MDKYDNISGLIPDNYFDLVICNDVIEHMPDHESFLSSIKTKIKDDGCLIGSIPNVRFYKNLIRLMVFRDWKYEDSGTLDRTHMRFFTEKSIKRTLDDIGYTIDFFKGINSAIKRPFKIKRIPRKIFYYFIWLLTLGSYSDIQYLQFGFRVKKRPTSVGR
jgi:SAM-dependent methyltransferase